MERFLALASAWRKPGRGDGKAGCNSAFFLRIYQAQKAPGASASPGKQLGQAPPCRGLPGRLGSEQGPLLAPGQRLPVLGLWGGNGEAMAGGGSGRSTKAPRPFCGDGRGMLPGLCPLAGATTLEHPRSPSARLAPSQPLGSGGAGGHSRLRSAFGSSSRSASSF